MSSWIGQPVLEIRTKKIGTVMDDVNGLPYRFLAVKMEDGKQKIVRLNNVQATKGSGFAWRFKSEKNPEKPRMVWVPFDDDIAGMSKEVQGPDPKGELAGSERNLT